MPLHKVLSQDYLGHCAFFMSPLEKMELIVETTILSFKTELNMIGMFAGLNKYQYFDSLKSAGF